MALPTEDAKPHSHTVTQLAAEGQTYHSFQLVKRVCEQQHLSPLCSNGHKGPQQCHRAISSLGKWSNL